MGTVLVRTDGSAALGLGHVTRCMALAHAFRDRGVEPRFVLRHAEEWVSRRVREAGYALELLPDRAALAEEPRSLRLLVEEHGAFGIVLDVCNTETVGRPAEYERYLAAVGALAPIVVIDDLTRVVFPAAVVVNPDVGARSVEYDARNAPLLLLGPRYALLGPVFRGEGGAGHRSGDGPVRSVAIALGGGAVSAEPLGAILAGVRRACGAEVSIRLVAGLGGDWAEPVERELAALTGDTRVMRDVPHLAQVLVDADLAVVSGGVTKFEAAACGTPAVIVAQVEHQVAWAEAFAATGAAVYAGAAAEVSASSIERIVAPLVGHPGLRYHMSMAGRALVDGLGATRVAEAALALCTPGRHELGRGAR